jgi:hypothetical protein
LTFLGLILLFNNFVLAVVTVCAAALASARHRDLERALANKQYYQSSVASARSNVDVVEFHGRALMECLLLSELGAAASAVRYGFSSLGRMNSFFPAASLYA